MTAGQAFVLGVVLGGAVFYMARAAREMWRGDGRCTPMDDDPTREWFL